MGDQGETTPARKGRVRWEYEHAFIQHSAEAGAGDLPIPLDVAAGLNAWGADGWEVVHMEGVWAWHQLTDGKSWPETLHGYYVTFKRQAEGSNSSRVALAEAEAVRTVDVSPSFYPMGGRVGS